MRILIMLGYLRNQVHIMFPHGESGMPVILRVKVEGHTFVGNHEGTTALI